VKDLEAAVRARGAARRYDPIEEPYLLPERVLILAIARVIGPKADVNDRFAPTSLASSMSKWIVIGS